MNGWSLLRASLASAAAANAVLVAPLLLLVLALPFVAGPAVQPLSGVIGLAIVVLPLCGMAVAVPLALAGGGLLAWLGRRYAWAARRLAWAWWGLLLGASLPSLLVGLLLSNAASGFSAWVVIPCGAAGAAGGLAFRRSLGRVGPPDGPGPGRTRRRDRRGDPA